MSGHRAVVGRLVVVGLGPGDARWLTREAEAALAAADALYGYGPYLDRLPSRLGQARHPSDNREEGARAATALRHASEGANIAVVSGGDPGVFAMAAAVCAEIEAGPQAWRTLGLWREGYYADIDLDEQPAEQPAAAAPREGESGIKFTADERHQISDLLGEIAAVATMLQRRLQQ